MTTPREKAQALLKSSPDEVLCWIEERIETEERLAAAKKGAALAARLIACGFAVSPVGEGVGVFWTSDASRDSYGRDKEGRVSEAALELAKNLRLKADDIERLVYE